MAKLEAAGWLGRAPWVWGEGSIAWLTGTGVELAGLGGVRAVKPPPATTTVSHGVLVGWSAARVERRGWAWKASRELAVERERWSVRAHCERGWTELLADLAVWLTRDGPPLALIAESGGRREDRQRMILEGWRDAILSGRYAAVYYDCSSDSVARWIRRLATRVGLTGPAFHAAVQMSARELALLSPAADDEPAREDSTQPGQAGPSPVAQIPTAPPSPSLPEAGQVEPAEPPEPAVSEPETPEPGAERERLYRQIMGLPEPRSRRRWRR
ncbi:MAG: hypothetical protein ACRDNJ_15960 [Solirubrobacteraceae bacterium]